MKDFYVSTALIPKNQGTVSMIILYPLNSMEHDLRMQRLAFFGTAFLAILALSIFSWFFTGKMIAPLEENRQAQTEFIAAASHELRSPLAVILSGISAMKKAKPAEQSHFLSVIEKEGTRMSLLVNDMLSLSNCRMKSSHSAVVTRNGSVRFWESFWTMPSVMYLNMEKFSLLLRRIPEVSVSQS